MVGRKGSADDVGTCGSMATGAPELTMEAGFAAPAPDPCRVTGRGLVAAWGTAGADCSEAAAGCGTGPGATAASSDGAGGAAGVGAGSGICAIGAGRDWVGGASSPNPVVLKSRRARSPNCKSTGGDAWGPACQITGRSAGGCG